MQESNQTRGKTGATSVIPRTEEKEEIGAGKEYEKLAENIRETIKEVVPKKKNLFKNGRSVSEETKQLYKDRVKEFSKGKPTSQRRKEWNRKIKNAGKNDYRRWVSRWTEEIERTNAKGDLKAIYRGVKAVIGAKRCFSATQPTTLQGQRLKNPEELANAWRDFLEKKFEATDLERARADFEALPICADEKQRRNHKTRVRICSEADEEEQVHGNRRSARGSLERVGSRARMLVPVPVQCAKYGEKKTCRLSSWWEYSS